MSSDSLVPAVFHHANNIYNAMLESAEKHASGKVVYTGYITKLVNGKLAIPTPTMSKAMNLLTDMDCLEQLKRGGGGTPSVWWIKEQPTEGNYFLWKAKKSRTENGKAPAGRDYAADIKELKNENAKLRETLQKVQNSIFDIGARVERLDERYSHMEKMMLMLTKEKQAEESGTDMTLTL